MLKDRNKEKERRRFPFELLFITSVTYLFVMKWELASIEIKKSIPLRIGILFDKLGRILIFKNIKMFASGKHTKHWEESFQVFVRIFLGLLNC